MVAGLGYHEALARRRGQGDIMGQPVVHFEVIGTDGAALRSFYSDAMKERGLRSS